MADYPSSKWAGNGSLTDLVDFWNASRANALNDEVVAIEEELGVNPAGDFEDVVARLEAGEHTYANDIDADAGAVVMVPEFTYDSVTYDGMLVQKYPACQPNATPWDDNPDVGDGGAIGGTKPTARAGVSPWREITYLAAREACGELGVGWFLLPAHMWAHLAYRSLYYGTLPHGPNADTNPPSDVDNGTTGTRDAALAARGSHNSALTGTGHVSWSHNWRADGVYGLNGVIWQWSSGLFLLPESLSDDSTTPHAITGVGEDGFCLIHANRNLSMRGSPFGKSTAVAAGSLTDSNKAWSTDEFAGCYLYDKAGNLYYIDSNTATTLSIDGSDTPTAGVYEILKLVSTDITSGMSSGSRILTLQSSADLKPLAIPATAGGTGSATYGKAGYWHAATALRAALRGGGWASGVGAGAFALYLYYAPSSRSVGGGFRACKAL